MSSIKVSFNKEASTKPNKLLHKSRYIFSSFVQATSYSLFLSHLIFIPYTHAGPNGGNVVGGSGSISQSGFNTTINQTTSSMAINWDSYNLSANERVQYIQPGSSSISLNRILSHSGSEIHGRIDANGQVILVNPNGVFFGPTSQINVGGLIASGLDISPTDFMNGNYIFNEVLGTNGTVINSGLINASLGGLGGGNVTLIGKQVKNEGVINARLGAINLAAAKQAVLTFDNDGLIGIRVSKEILQEELGIDPAVINSGEINAEGGRILLTASVSQDVFSQAVNTGDIQQATSVVVNKDGTFTLGAGSDVVNTGSIDVSSTEQNPGAGQVVVLGQNITSSGSIKADAVNVNGGDIELHSKDITLLIENSITSARSEANGQGGIVKVLGDRVGLFDQSTVDASGATGGGEVLIGGDQQGVNSQIRNANFIYLDENSQVKVDALIEGNGGKLITFAKETARIYGDLYSRGGLVSGSGGFIETSGLNGFEIIKTPDVSSINGLHGEWLIDPHNIEIVTGGASTNIDTVTNPFTSTADTAVLGVNLIIGALTGGATVTISTGTGGAVNTVPDLGNIVFSTNLDYTGKGNATLTLNAHNNIDINSFDITGNASDSLNLTFNANSDGTGTGDVLITNSEIGTNGGTFTASGENFTSTRGGTTSDTIDTAGGDVTLTMTGAVDIGAEIITNGGDFTVTVSSAFTNANANGLIDTATAGGGNGDVSITSSGAVTLGDVTTAANKGDLSIVAGGDITDGFGSLDINGITRLTAGLNNVILNNGNDFKSSVYIVSAQNVTMNDSNSILLGDAAATSTFNVIANGVIDQAVLTGLTVGGASSFSSTLDHADITLDSVTNDLQGAISLSTVGDNRGDILLTNTSSLTTLAAIDAFGNFTVNADQNLNIDGAISVSNSRGGTNARTMQLNFGQDGTSPALFNLNNTGSISTATGANDTVAITIDSGGSSNTYNFNTGSSVTLSSGGSLTVNGNIGIDTFNVNIALPATINGAGSNDILNASNNINDWLISSTNRGELTSGGFTTSFQSIERINGGTGIDTLTGPNQTVAWDIGAGSGNLSDGSNLLGTGFFNFENYIGGNRDDTFVIQPLGIFGLIDGGGESVRDIVNVSSRASNILIIGADVTNVERVIGNNLDSTLIAENLKNIWTITSNNDGEVLNANGTVEFIDFNNITGNNDVDEFSFDPGGAIDGTIDAAGNVDIVDYSGLAVVNISLTNAFSGVINAETVRGNNINSTLTGDNIKNTWTITGNNDGEVVNVGGTINFEDFNNLIGGTADDDFNFNALSFIDGLIDGGLAVTEDTVGMAALASVSLVLGQDVTGIERITGNNTDSTLTGRSINNTWNITGNNDGNVDGVNFVNFNNLTGGAGDDNFIYGISGVLSGLINGGNATTIDTVNGVALAAFSIDLATDITNIEQVTGNNTASTLIGQNKINNWNITDANDGAIDGVNFINFNNLMGGTNNDRFIYFDGGSISGLVSGGNQVVNDIFDLSNMTTANLSLASFFANTTGIERILGNNTASTLLGQNVNNTWNITGSNDGNVAGVDFFDFNNLTGGSVDDDFIFNASGSLTGLIDGAGASTVDTVNGAALTTFSLTIGTDVINVEQVTGNNLDSTLIGGNVVNNWNINNTNDGTIGALTFIDFNNLIGGSNDDAFKFTTGGDITGIIDGQAHVIADTVDLSLLATVNVDLGASLSSFINVETIKGNNTDSTLTGENINNSWIVSDVNDGSVQNVNGTVAFVDFNNITGGDQDDAFTINPTGSITGVIDGGNQAIADSIDYSSLASVVVNVGAPVTGINGLEGVIGNGTDSTINATDSDNTWIVDGVNSGSVGSLVFTDFNMLNGGSGIDTFNVNGGSAIIKGGDGNDIVNVNLSGTENGTIVFDGEGHSAGDVVYFLGGSAGYVGDFNSNVTGSNDDRFVYTNAGNTFSVTYKNTESVQDDLIANTLTVNGTAANDSIELDNQIFTVNGARSVNYNSANKNNLTVDGQAANDVINILGSFNISDALSLIVETVANSSASTITANELVISNVTNAGSSANRLLTNVNNLSVLNSGSVYVQDVDSINVTQLINASLLELSNATGDITDGSALISSGEFKLTANSGNILLDNNNQLSGPLSLVATLGDVTLNNTVNTDLALVDAQNLTITSTGQLTDSGIIAVSGDTTLASASGIVLDSANNFNTLTVNNAASLVINDINSINMLSIDTTGTTNVTSNGIALGRVNASTVNLDAGSGQITDTNGDNVNVTSGSLVMRATSGIGSGNAIETSTAELDVINNGAGGQVKIKNTGGVLLTNLVNNGDIDFSNDTKVTIDHVDAGFTVGTFRLDVANGSVFGVDRGGVNFFTVPDITADAAFVTVNGEFGTFARPIVLKLNSEFFLASTVSSTFFIPEPPPVVNDTSDLQLSVFDSLNSVSGQRLIEIESIADINPAIFTDLHNYNQENISIRLPRDQMFEDELEIYDRL